MKLFLARVQGSETVGDKHIPGERKDANIFTKNVTSAIFNCHTPLYIGSDECLSQAQASSGEAVERKF
jgi:hypothetical protein